MIEIDDLLASDRQTDGWMDGWHEAALTTSGKSENSFYFFLVFSTKRVILYGDALALASYSIKSGASSFSLVA